MKASATIANRPFKVIAFDWDGTAVVDRKDDVTPLLGTIERLLRAGVVVVVVTGTNMSNVDAQFSSRLRGRHKRNLYVATNRGSEVFSFDEQSQPFVCSRRTATAEEENLLTLVADRVRDNLMKRTRLELKVIYDRLNRRKIDLIPLPRWSDPPKSAFGELLAAVETRLESAGLSGIGEAVELTRVIAAEVGLADARITSDVKHIEVGLTDKADSVEWLFRELVQNRGISPSDVLIGGDEFGAIAGFSGSDSRMMIPESAGATFVSVGLEPGGVPSPVIHLGGGPAAFRELLRVQAALHPVVSLGAARPPDDWVIRESGVSLARERELESIFAISNGYVGTRGSLAEGSACSSPDTFVAGVFEPEPGSVPAMTRIFDWTALSVRVEQHPVRLETVENLDHHRTLDMRHATLTREWRFKDPSGRITRFRGIRFVSLSDRHILAQSVSFTPENYTGTICIEARMSSPFVIHTASGMTVACAMSSHLESPQGSIPVVGDGFAEEARRGQIEHLKFHAELGKTYRLDRLVAIHSSRDSAHPLDEATEHVRSASCDGALLLLEEHRRAWSQCWQNCEVTVEGDPAAERALRFAMYHLVSAANPDDPHYSIGARALTGQAYKGHVFWDTDIYMLPFFVMTYPEAARALLLYRYNTLPGARAKAARMGYRGAMYAWESADTGEEVTPPFVVAPDGDVIPIRVGDEEQHITADVAFAVWKYWEATGDESFLLEAGAQILLETARFWASRVERGDDDLYHIHRVIGPDEYHESVDDNAYTNVMAQHNLNLGAKVAGLIAERWPEHWRALAAKVHLADGELLQWSQIASRMFTGFDSSTGLYEQFRGYFDLEEMEIPPFEERSAPADVLFGRARVQRSKLIKQPDVLMLIYLLWDEIPPAVREANFRYYEARTSHGSSLSPPIHAALAARLGDIRRAEDYFRQTADIDLSDNMGNAAGGVHAAALGGLWQAVVFGFAGLTLGPEGPSVSPNLPRQWRRLAFRVKWRGETYAIDLPGRAVAVETSSSEVNA